MDSDGSHIMNINGAVILGILLALRIFFSCCEAAFTEINDSRVKSFENEKGGKGRVFGLLSKPSRLMSTFAAHRTVNTALFVLAATVCTVSTGLEVNILLVYILTALLSSAVVFFIGDALPKRFIREKNAERIAVSCSFAVSLLRLLMMPLTALAGLASVIASGISGSETTADEAAVTEEEILMMVDVGNESGSIESSEKEMINNVCEFHEMTVSDVMTHRTDIAAVDIDAEISDVVYTAINSGFSRIPVYSGSVDHIEGIIHVKDLLCLVGSQSADSMDVKSFLRDVEFVPESCMCDDLFKTFTAGRIQLAVAVDEYGGTAGLVTMEDLVEAIVGNIRDEYDTESDDITEISDNTWIISGNANATDTMETLGCPLPDDSGYDTMGGFITDLLGRIPEDGETPSAEYEDMVFTVLLTEDMHILKIKAVKKEKSERMSEKNEDDKDKKI
ncbi:MAG: hemolysin family protein [Huintestinicola sp.]